MKTFKLFTVTILACLMIIPVVHGNENQIYRTLLEKHADAVVSVKAVLSVEIRMMGQGEDEESRIEFSGIFVNNSGLVMVPYQLFSGENLRRVLSGAGSGIESNVSLQDLTVITGGKEYDAYLVATDSDLDLAFIQLENADGEDFKFIDFSNHKNPETGNTLYYVSRLGEGFDFAPHVREATITGELNRPREAWIVSVNQRGFGLAVFDSDGTLAGVVTTLQDTKEEVSGGGRFGISRMLSGAGDMSSQAVVLPIEVIQPLISAAEERAMQE